LISFLACSCRQTLLDKLAAGITLVVDRYAYSGIAYSSAKEKDTMGFEVGRR